MKITKPTLVIVLTATSIVALLLYYIGTWPGADSELAAYVKGDYVTAVRQFREAAEQGDAAAQYNLALMYSSGKGVPEDAVEAMQWFRKAAEQGYAFAQYNLSMGYYFGHGVPQDYVEAYKWLALAADQGETHAKDAMPMLENKLSSEQLAEAQQALQTLSHNSTN